MTDGGVGNPSVNSEAKMGSIHQIRMPAKILTNMVGWFQNDFLGVTRQVRWSYLPPLMVYFAAGVSGFTGIIESFFVKENLGLNIYRG